MIDDSCTITIGSSVIRIADVKSGKDIGGKHIDTQIVFFVNRDKVVLHFYNTTQLILINGHGYDRFIETFLKPFFETKIETNLEHIEAYNAKALVALGGLKMVKRSSVKYTESPTHLWCTRCDFAAKSRTALAKHKKQYMLFLLVKKPLLRLLWQYQSINLQEITHLLLRAY